MIRFITLTAVMLWAATGFAQTTLSLEQAYDQSKA